jgi:HSP20 family molecular chaperone IbpA
MSLIAQTRGLQQRRHSLFDDDEFFPKDMLDELDMLQNNVLDPFHHNSYRMTLDCAGYSAKNIRMHVAGGNKIVVKGHEDEDEAGGDYSHKTFKKTFVAPVNCDLSKMSSYMTRHGTLVIEIPYMKKDKDLALTHLDHVEEMMLPKVIEHTDGSKEVELDLELPDGVDPVNVNVTANERDIIVKAEEKHEAPNELTQHYYFRRSSLPPDTDVHDLKCTMDHNKLVITAPIKESNGGSVQAVENGNNHRRSSRQ